MHDDVTASAPADPGEVVASTAPVGASPTPEDAPPTAALSRVSRGSRDSRAPSTPRHPHLTLPPVPAWLDEVEGEQALAWVSQRNAETLGRLGATERFSALERDIEVILDSPDRIPVVAERAGLLYNFWTDATHPRGLWRRTTWDSYRAGARGPDGTSSGTTEWEVLLDLDALGREEGVTWVWHGAEVLRSTGERALVTLSEGGSDADVTREYDLVHRRFIAPEDGGFHRRASKGSMSWADDEGASVLVMGDLGPGSVTSSGYPRQARRLHRGQRPQDAEVLGTCATDAVGLFVGRDRWGRTWVSIAQDFHASRTWLVPDGVPLPRVDDPAGADALHQADESVPAAAVLVEVPESARVDVGHDWLTVELREDWQVGGRLHTSGTLLAARLEDFLAGSRRMSVLFPPTASTSLAGASWTRDHLVLTVLDDVVDRLEVLVPPQADAPPGTAWERTIPDLAFLTAPSLPHPGEVDVLDPEDSSTAEGGPADRLRATPSGTVPGPGEGAGAGGGRAGRDGTETDASLLRPGRALLTVSAGGVDPLTDNLVWVTATGWTTPSTLALAALTPAGNVTAMEVLRRAPARFDAEGVQVSQHVAVSEDGTRVPYFQVGRPDPDGAPAPTILYGYGGFEHVLLPGYQPVTGKAWLERGGTYVVANIRGGGEYGPLWHRRALKADRHRSFEDFAAVALSLQDRGVTTPSRLAVHGGSNGGLLVGVMLTRYPELVGAVVCEVPLLDMGRYTHLLAGASWAAEYGDPDSDDEWDFIQEFSPFHLVREGVDYPPVLFITSTRDDRVHPAHARTMAYRMLELGQDVEYFENSEGGHGRASTNAQRARMNALIHEFCWRRLTATG